MPLDSPSLFFPYFRTHLRLYALLALLLLILLTGARTLQAATPKRLLAYYAYWNDNYRAAQIPYSKLTHIAHAFLAPGADGSLKVPDRYLEPAHVSNAHAAGVKVLASVGGADDSANFPVIAASPSLRTTFADNVEQFLRANEYDGVDIDYEFPQSSADRANLNLMIQVLRDKFNASPAPAPSWLITMAVSADDYYGQWNDYATLDGLVDFYNVMTYDFHGSWSDHSGHNSPLYRGNDPQPDGSVADALDYMLNDRHVPAAQMNVGVPFYGYNFVYSEKLYDNCHGDCSTKQFDYRKIPAKIGHGWTYYWDSASQVPYLRKDKGTGVLTFDNPRSIRKKVNYALHTRGVGGVFLWELSEDYSNQQQPLLNALYNAYSKP